MNILRPRSGMFVGQTYGAVLHGARALNFTV